MSIWPALVSAALLGTRRAAPPAPQVAPGLEPLLAQWAALDGRDAAQQLLVMAASLDLYEQIGRHPARGAPPSPLPAGAEDLPLCTPEAAALLAQLLDVAGRTLLPDYLRALAASGQRLPPSLLPNLLAAGAKQAALRPLILPVLGRQGRRLAARNPAWVYAAADIDSWPGLRRAWQEEDLNGRSALVQQLRATDPARGRALFENTWRSENDFTRLRLLKLLSEGLSMADEPLLETALDDRSHLVRREAAELLAALPASRLAARMSAYVPQYLLWTPQDEHQISIQLPQVTPAMRRDGIIGMESKDAARVRSHEIIQLVSAVPLAYWAKHWAAPETITRAIGTTLWPRTLTSGLVTAVVRQRDPDWAAVLLDELGLSPLTGRLLPVAGPETIRMLAGRALHENDGQDLLDKRGPLVMLLRRWPHAWPADLALEITAVFADHFAATSSERSPDTLLRTTLLDAGLTFPPQIADSAEELLASSLAASGPWRVTASEFMQRLRLRGRMAEALPNMAVLAAN